MNCYKELRLDRILGRPDNIPQSIHLQGMVRSLAFSVE